MSAENFLDFSNFLDVQTGTAWGRTLADFAKFCDPHSAARTLDVGCGPGLLSAIFSQQGCTAVGVDVDLKLLASGLHAFLAAADVFHLPFESHTFDLITAVNVLFLLDDPEAALSEMVRLLKPMGRIALLNPSEHISIDAAVRLADERGLDGPGRESLLNWARIAEGHVRWTDAEMEEMLKRAGVTIETSRLRIGPGFARYVRGILHV